MGCIQSSPAAADKQAPDTPAKDVQQEHSSRAVNGVHEKDVSHDLDVHGSHAGCLVVSVTLT
jgi:hypothetical protein